MATYCQLSQALAHRWRLEKISMLFVQSAPAEPPSDCRAWIRAKSTSSVTDKAHYLLRNEDEENELLVAAAFAPRYSWRPLSDYWSTTFEASSRHPSRNISCNTPQRLTLRYERISTSGSDKYHLLQRSHHQCVLIAHIKVAVKLLFIENKCKIFFVVSAGQRASF